MVFSAARADSINGRRSGSPGSGEYKSTVRALHHVSCAATRSQIAREPSASSPLVCRAASARNCRRNAALVSLALLIRILRRTPLFQSFLYFLLRALPGRFVIALLRAQIILRHEMARMIMRVLVTFAM